MKYMGIDHHKQYLIATVMDEQGQILRKDRVTTERTSMRNYIQQVNGNDSLTAVLEACYGWHYVYDELLDLVDEVKVAHPLKTRAIAEARIKTDSIDSETLAYLLRTDLIPEAYAPGFETRDKKNLLRYRFSLVKTRTKLKNIVHAVLSRNYISDANFKQLSDKFGKQGRAYLRMVKLKGQDSEILNHYLDLIEYFDEKIKLAEKKTDQIFKEDEICKLLKSIPGIGKLSAVLIKHEIDNIDRFISAGKLCSYAGLVPSTYSSGGRTYQGRITKQGNKWLRWTLVEAAQTAINKDPWLRSFYDKIAKRRGNKRAKVAVARKLLEIIYRIWQERRPYYKKPVSVAL